MAAPTAGSPASVPERADPAATCKPPVSPRARRVRRRRRYSSGLLRRRRENYRADEQHRPDQAARHSSFRSPAAQSGLHPRASMLANALSAAARSASTPGVPVPFQPGGQRRQHRPRSRPPSSLPSTSRGVRPRSSVSVPLVSSTRCSPQYARWIARRASPCSPASRAARAPLAANRFGAPAQSRPGSVPRRSSRGATSVQEAAPANRSALPPRSRTPGSRRPDALAMPETNLRTAPVPNRLPAV